MRPLALASLGLLALACGELPSGAPTRCFGDQDCADDERCVDRACAPVGFVLDAGLLPLDAGFEAPDAGPVDAGTADAGPADAEPGDAAVDAGSLDAAAPDAGPADASAPDAAAPDAAAPDAGPPDAGPPTDAGPVARGAYQYRRVLVPGLSSSRVLTRAAVTPDDRTLVVSGRVNDLFVIDRATETLRGAPRLPSVGAGRVQVVEALHPRPGGAELIVASTVLEAGSPVEGRLHRLSTTGTAAPTLLGAPIPGIALHTITRDPATGDVALVGRREAGGGYWVTVHALDPATGAITARGQRFTGAGCQDGAALADGLGGRGVAYACGINGGEVGVLDSTGAFTPGPSVGNTARLAARPQGDYALAVTWSAGRLSRFEAGQWTVGFNTPDVGTSAWGLAFSDDGARALIFGQYAGSVASLREFRHGGYSSAALTDVSIPAFDAAPYLGRSGVLMEAAAWRPGGDCGYLVGGCDSVNCSLGYLVAFEVTNGRPCP